ncbi:pyridoxamine 5'-phosphate oxidase family protein [Bifidobacterium crudilactis]|jgi:nitroimidazol reductase NimA-like FMN-containing flavoprotein (pyridoxamine 5'-phosphate oxidase superfamily)|uniref:pyridoxamine 5'-phosphate oxidase family protein n=1 Tax=Bifidobacterium crudilactis TaxID=327277 RepID=UPI002354D8D7|nr:pyridoxamine 5'-phosphate oxidase family protein [Bifidobacterium crudilactis]MCI2149367.1 pyridoxamine 5'-phosphate oxidase family protein [Bifidobacterium crudilactis]MCI2158111.1 pyridoxamine 5'-phosphate oxidase family protein [Bifidobacterium crudilactis]
MADETSMSVNQAGVQAVHDAGADLGAQTRRKSTRRDHEHTVAGRHRRMRRADREVTEPEEIRAILDGCDIVRIAYQDDEGLSIVPVNFGYSYDPGTGDGFGADTNEASPSLTLFLHSALHGRKIDAMRAAGNALNVAFEMECDCEVIEGRTACNWSESFTSIIGTGVASVVDDFDEANAALSVLMAKQAHMPDVRFTERQLATVTVWKVVSTHFTAKNHPKPAPHRRTA